MSDDLIATETMAKKRAQQELAEHVNLVKESTLKISSIKVLDVGAFESFSFSKLGIDGDHKVMTWALSTDFKAHYTTVKIRQSEPVCDTSIVVTEVEEE